VSEPAHGLLLVNGRQEVRTRFQPLSGDLSWYGKLGGNPVRPGGYRLRLGAEDLAGNRSLLPSSIILRVRYIELARDVIRAKARTRFGVGVDTDARRYGWRFAGRSGRSGARLLVLRAPGPGRYRLFVDANGHANSARVIVVPRER
jgi:hypothetical protein